MKRIYFCLILLVFLFLQTCVKTPTTLVNNTSQNNVSQNIPFSKIPLEKDFLLNDVSVSLFKQKGVLATYHHNSGESITVFGPIIGELISMGNGSYFSKNYYKIVWLSADKINSLVSYIDEKGYPVASVVNESTTLFYERDEKNKSVNTWAYYPDGKTEVINDTITSFYIKSISSGLSEDATKRIVFSSVYNSVNYSCLPKSPVRKFFSNSCGSNIAKTIKEDPIPNELKKVECDINCQNIVASKSNVVESNSFALVKTKIKEATKINSSIYNIVSSIVRPSKETPTFILSESYNQGNSVPIKTISINGNIELLTRSMGSPDSPSSGTLIPSSYFLVGLTLEAVGSNLQNPVIAKTQNKGTSYSFSNVSIPSGTKYLLINVYTVYTSGKPLPSSERNVDTYSLGNILRKAVVDIDNKDSTVNIDISSTATALLISSTNIEGIKGSKKFASFEIEKQKIVKLLTDKVESGYSVIINPNVLSLAKESAKELVTSTSSLSYIRINLSDISSSFQTKSISSVFDKISSLSLYVSGNDNNIDVEKKLTKEDISIYYSQSDGFITVPVELPDDKKDFRVTGIVTDEKGKNYQGDGVLSKSIGNIRLYLENMNPCYYGKFVYLGSEYQDFIAITPPMKTLDGTGCKQSFIEKRSYSSNSKNEATGLLIGKSGQDTFFVGGSIYKKWMEKGIGGTTTTGFPTINKIKILDTYEQSFEKGKIIQYANGSTDYMSASGNISEFKKFTGSVCSLPDSGAYYLPTTKGHYYAVLVSGNDSNTFDLRGSATNSRLTTHESFPVASIPLNGGKILVYKAEANDKYYFSVLSKPGCRGFNIDTFEFVVDLDFLLDEQDIINNGFSTKSDGNKIQVYATTIGGSALACGTAAIVPGAVAGTAVIPGVGTVAVGGASFVGAASECGTVAAGSIILYELIIPNIGNISSFVGSSISSLTSAVIVASEPVILSSNNTMVSNTARDSVFRDFIPNTGRYVNTIGHIYLATKATIATQARTELRSNLANNGESCNDDDAHHIVLFAHKAAQPARKVLNDCNIDINGSENGICLPVQFHRLIDKLTGKGLHRFDEYIDPINKLLTNTYSDNKANCSKVRKAMETLKSELRNGRRDFRYFNL